MRILGLTNMDDNTPLSDGIEAYARSLEAAGKAEKTILWYIANLLRFGAWLQEEEWRESLEICQLRSPRSIWPSAAEMVKQQPRVGVTR